MKPLSLTLEELRSIEPRFGRLEEAPIEAPGQTAILGWQSHAMGNQPGLCLGGGLAETRETARRIALAETMERACFRILLNSDQREQFALDAFPTSCGFAAGFESEPTRMRSICEAVERWARALWIDEGYALTKASVQARELPPLTQFFLSPFAEIRIFEGHFSVQDPIRKISLPLRLGMVVGFTADGAFPGSRVCAEEDSPWEHASLEAWRHHRIFERGGLPGLPAESALRRISYFGTHREEALAQIERGGRQDWPEPRIVVHRSFEAASGKLHVWRSLCADYLGWDRGDVQRFVY